jgi:hypothetical protein
VRSIQGAIVTERDEFERPTSLTGELSQELALVHVILESFPAVDENDWDFVIILASKFGVSVHIDFVPGEAALTRKLVQALFDDLAEMASFARINHDAGKR